ncbi:MAG: GNAT family N-acetyltransferase [Armatimonadetes bacterium]|nr:GNAT family N-acetyltransferase [Armatimonadota bacterium]
MQVNIRKAALNDLDNVIDLASEYIIYSLSPYRDVLIEKIKEFRRKDFQNLKNILDFEKTALYIAENEKGEFLGHILIFITPFESAMGELQGYIFDLAVKQEYWGKGIGKLLIRQAEEFTKEKGLNYLTLGVSSSNQRAIKLYESLGFKEERKKFIKKVINGNFNPPG